MLLYLNRYWESDVKCLVTVGYGETYKDYLCFLRAVAVHLYGSAELKTNAAKFFSDFLHDSGHDAINFRGVSMDHLVFAENAIKYNSFIFDIDIEDGDIVDFSETKKYSKTLLFLWKNTKYFTKLNIEIIQKEFQ